MRKKFVKVLMALTITTVMVSGTMAVHAAEESYTTKPGDNLSKIAKEVYGDAHNWRVIYERNKDQIRNPDLIWPNQILMLPDLGIITVEQQTPIDDEQTAVSTIENTVPTSTTPDTVSDVSVFMQNVYNLMATKNYTAMNDVDGSDTAESYVNTMTGDHTIYIPDGSLTGIGAGVYKTETGAYYFYYGDYVDGVRTGKGVSFIKSFSNAYEYYDGMWSNDAPNGEGMITFVVDNGEVNILNGTLVNGLWNGDVKIVAASMYGDILSCSFTANNGVPTDKTDEYLSHLKYLEYSRDDVVSENQIVYAFGGLTNGGVVDGVEQYYDDARVSFSCTPGTHIGVFGWAD